MATRALEPHTADYAVNLWTASASSTRSSDHAQPGGVSCSCRRGALSTVAFWKAQVPYFARHGFRVLVFDGRGNGRSGRPATGYRTDDFVQDTLSVLDAVGIKTAVL